MQVHVFGISPFPAFLLGKAAKSGRSLWIEFCEFCEKNLYVDGELMSLASGAIDLVKGTEEALREEEKFRLHTIASNSQDEMNALSENDKATHLKNNDLGVFEVHMQRSLCLY